MEANKYINSLHTDYLLFVIQQLNFDNILGVIGILEIKEIVCEYISRL